MEHSKNLSFPIGEYVVPKEITAGHLRAWTEMIEELPAQLEKIVNRLTTDQLNTPYRPGGWTVQQLVHHIADSHMNAYIRVKLGMSEDNPTIKPYDQEAWVAMPDSEMPVAVSLGIIRGLHARWVYVLKPFQAWDRTIFHPELKTSMRLDELTGMYAWHGAHHLAHIKGLVEREGW